jgi:hypothetical protein
MNRIISRLLSGTKGKVDCGLPELKFSLKTKTLGELEKIVPQAPVSKGMGDGGSSPKIHCPRLKAINLGFRKEINDDIKAADLAMEIKGCDLTTAYLELIDKKCADQIAGTAVQMYLMERYGLSPAEDKRSGDCKTANGTTIEIKSSLGKLKPSFQSIRSSHNVDWYMLAVYNKEDGPIGKGIIMLISHKDMDELCEKYGYLSKNTGYWSLPFYMKNTPRGTKGYNLWLELQSYIVEECEVPEPIAAMTPVARTGSPSPLTGGALDKNL